MEFLKGMRWPRVGDPVIWYPEANRDMAGTPGIVVAAGVQGVVDIVVHTLGGGHQVRGSVWYVDDPKLQENEYIRHKDGGWEYAAWFRELTELRVSVELLLAKAQRVYENKAAGQRGKNNLANVSPEVKEKNRERMRELGRNQSPEQRERARQQMKKMWAKRKADKAAKEAREQSKQAEALV
jgi:hypothetical protein